VSAVEDLQTNLDYVWTVPAAMLVFFMQAGFALLETGRGRTHFSFSKPSLRRSCGF